MYRINNDYTSTCLCGKHIKRIKTLEVIHRVQVLASSQVDRGRVARGLAQLFVTMDRGILGVLFLMHRDQPRQPLSAISIPLIRR